jgi:hypothetical protein
MYSLVCPGGVMRRATRSSDKWLVSSKRDQSTNSGIVVELKLEVTLKLLSMVLWPVWNFEYKRPCI